jgi:hypothetical protein
VAKPVVAENTIFRSSLLSIKELSASFTTKKITPKMQQTYLKFHDLLSALHKISGY